MTIFLALGLFAALYMLWLLFSLATYALPFYIGLTVTFWLLGSGHGFIGSALLGFLAAALTLIAGQLLFRSAASSLVRFGVASLFTVPAGFAGFQAVHGIGRLAIGDGFVLAVLSGIGALVIASAAWRKVAATPAATTAARAVPIEQARRAAAVID